MVSDCDNIKDTKHDYEWKTLKGAILFLKALTFHKKDFSERWWLLAKTLTEMIFW